MTSLSGQQYSTKTMSGLSNTYSNNIVCDTIDINNSLTLEPGGVLTLPPNSIQDSYLSNNVAFRNQSNIFIQPNIFTSTVNFQGGGSETQLVQVAGGFGINNVTNSRFVSLSSKTSGGVAVSNIFCRDGNQAYLQSNSTATNRIDITGTQATIGGTSVPVITTQPIAGSNNNEIASTQWTTSNFGRLTLSTGSTVQTWFGNNRFTSNSSNLALSIDNTDVPVYDGGLFITSVAGQGNPITTVGNLTLIANGIGIDTGILSMCVNSSTSCGIRIGPQSMSLIVNTTLTMSGTNFNNNITNYNVSGIVQFTNATTPVITQSIPANDSTTKISTTNWVDTYFGKKTLSLGSTVQTWFGSNRFTSNSSNLAVTLQNTDAPTYIGSGLFIASASAQLNPFVALGDTVLISNGTGASNGILCLCSASSTSSGIRISGSSININGATTLTVNSLTTTYNNNATNYNVSGVTSFTNVTTPVITQAISLADNSTKISTTAFVKGQNYITSSALTPYALLNPSALQIWGTNQNQFNTQVNMNSSAIRFVDTGSSKISQVGSDFIIENISNLNSVQIRSTTSGLVQRTGLLIENGITCTLQGGAGNTITITGLNTPTLGIPPVAGVYSSEIATTNWVNTELTGVYARLNPIALQIWGTNENQFNTQVTMNLVGTRYLDTTNSSLISQIGNNLRLENISNSNSIQLRTKTSTGVVSQNLLCRNGNEIVMKGNVGIVRILDSACTIECVTFSSDAVSFSTDAPITTNYNTFVAVPTKGIYDIGYNFEIAGTSFANWVGFTTTGNVVTVNFDGTGNFVRGVYQVDIVLTTEISSSPNTRLIWTQVSSTSSAITPYCTYESTGATFNTTNYQIMRLSFILKVSTYTSTYYLNYVRTAGVGSGLVENKANSHIQFTRIA